MLKYTINISGGQKCGLMLLHVQNSSHEKFTSQVPKLGGFCLTWNLVTWKKQFGMINKSFLGLKK